MLNQSILVGRIVSDPKINETEKELKITLAVHRSFKNENGDYDNDFIDCVLYGSIAKNMVEYCKKGDLVGVKGRLQKLSKDDELVVVAEKITFLNPKSGESNE